MPATANARPAVFESLLPSFVHLDSIRCRIRNSHDNTTEMVPGHMLGSAFGLLPRVCTGSGRESEFLLD